MSSGSRKILAYPRESPKNLSLLWIRLDHFQGRALGGASPQFRLTLGGRGGLAEMPAEALKSASAL